MKNKTLLLILAGVAAFYYGKYLRNQAAANSIPPVAAGVRG